MGPERANLRPERGLRGGTDRQTYVMVHPCVLQDIGPLGPLPKKSDIESQWKRCERESEPEIVRK